VEAVDPLDRWTVHTDVFDGPLDLLLYLVKRDGIDLFRFPVARVTDAYLETLDRMRELHLGVAGEYLVMAATLVWLKSLELLPRAPTAVAEEEDGVDPREALAKRLREYQAYREAATSLDERVQVGRDVFVRSPDDLPLADRPLVSPIDAFGLLEVYFGLLKREPGDVTITIRRRGPDVAACARTVLDWLDAGGTDLGELLRTVSDRAERIAMFVAVLEMARMRWLDLRQDTHLGPVAVSRQPGEIDLERLGASVREAG